MMPTRGVAPVVQDDVVAPGQPVDQALDVLDLVIRGIQLDPAGGLAEAAGAEGEDGVSVPGQPPRLLAQIALRAAESVRQDDGRLPLRTGRPVERGVQAYPLVAVRPVGDGDALLRFGDVRATATGARGAGQSQDREHEHDDHGLAAPPRGAEPSPGRDRQ
ncbi:MAG TPA: hypothetical protein VHC49_11230 [Mycobacteriales bacterium]|nr:hypothetical protein [Mycobacteriales bacterium]